MRSQTQRVVFLLFHVDPVGDEVFVEDVAAQQEGMIRLERFDCAPKRIEFRTPDAAANPYVAFAALLLAGLDGIQNRMDPGDPLDKNL